MKYIKRPEFPEVVKLKKAIAKEDDKLQITIIGLQENKLDGYKKKIAEYARIAVDNINKVIKNFCLNAIPLGFHEGQNLSDDETKSKTGDDEKVNRKSKAIRELKKFGFRYSEKAIGYDTYIEFHNVCKNTGKDFISRMNGVIDKLKKTGDDTIYNVKEAIKAEFMKNGVMTVKYSNGNRASIESYAAMIARSARIESQNIGGIGRAIEQGTDIVKVEGMYPACPTCRKFIGKCFSVSGKDKRFPALFGREGPLNRGYAIIHPNCRCEFIPIHLDFETKDTVEQMIKTSNEVKKQDKTEAELYAAWQSRRRIEHQ